MVYYKSYRRTYVLYVSICNNGLVRLQYITEGILKFPWQFTPPPQALSAHPPPQRVSYHPYIYVRKPILI